MKIPLRKSAEKENAHDWLTKLQEEADEGETPKHLLPFSSDQECLKITLKNNKCMTCQEPKGKWLRSHGACCYLHVMSIW